MKMKLQSKALRNTLRTVGFLLCVFLLLEAFSFLMEPKSNTEESGIRYYRARGFYGEKEDTIDVFMVGNSNVYSGYSPMQLWGERGYTSFASGENSQKVADAYTVLQEFLKKQKPKLVIFEVDEVYEKGLDVVDSAMRRNFPVFEYHDRWKTIWQSNVWANPSFLWRDVDKGYMIRPTATAYTGKEYMCVTEERQEISVGARYSMDQIVALCREQDIQVMFLAIPCALSWNTGKHNAIADYAAENGIPFLDLNEVDKRKEMNFDWTLDTVDGGVHLNTPGAQKVTTYLSRYLSEKYALQDHRGEEKYALWGSDYADYCKRVK